MKSFGPAEFAKVLSFVITGLYRNQPASNLPLEPFLIAFHYGGLLLGLNKLVLTDFLIGMLPVYYNLWIECENKILSTPAVNKAEALAIFGKEIGQELTLEGDGSPAYLLDEWEIGPHWVNPTIPVFSLT